MKHIGCSKLTSIINKFPNILVHSRTLILLGLVLTTLGCKRHQALPQALQDYHERMYKVLALSTTDINIDSSLAFPEKSSIKIDIPELNINMREFYAIDNCGIKQHVAERNTVLGKVQLPSVRLNYEWRLIQLLQKCIENSAAQQGDQKIANLKDWLAQKEALYPLVWANMVTQSSEIYLSLSASSGFIDGSQKDNFTQALFDLKNINGMRLDPAVNAEYIEESLRSMQEHRLYARLWRSQILMTKHLNVMTADISNWANTFVCKTRKDREKMSIIRNVFNKYFAQEIQAIGAQMNLYHYSLTPELSKLIAATDLPQSFQNELVNYNDTGFNRYQSSILAHVKMWQEIFKKCG